MNEKDEKITGKQILSECVTLANHIGIYLTQIFKGIVSDTKAFFERKSNNKAS